MRAEALFHVAPREVEVRGIDLPAPAAGEVLIRSRCSAISPGTEAMVFAGAFPADAALDSRIAALKGGFSYPFRYGYALVGVVEATGTGVDEALVGTMVFAFHPHQDRAVVPLADCLAIPDGLTPEAAIFLPQVESALNFVMDGAPLVGEAVPVRVAVSVPVGVSVRVSCRRGPGTPGNTRLRPKANACMENVRTNRINRDDLNVCNQPWIFGGSMPF